MRRFALSTAVIALMIGRGTAFGQSTPYNGDPAPVPGTIQIEDYDWGGQGVAYFDTTPGNAGGAYRSEDVDIAALDGGGYGVGWTVAGEWLNYSVNVQTSGNYTVTFRVASDGQGGTFHLESNWSDLTGAMTIPDTGGWNSWQPISTTIYLSAGPQVLSLWLESEGGSGAVGNFDWMQLTSSGGGGGSFRVMTWNVDQGYSSDDHSNYTLPQQVQYMAQSNADVILLQEVDGSQDQQDQYLQGLEGATGQTWYSVWAPGGWCCLGVMILTRYPLQASQAIMIPWETDNRSSLAFGQISVNSVPINIFTNHLDYGDTDTRTLELLELMTWADGFGGPRLVGGDFNSWWDEWWIHTMETEYSDTKLDLTQNEDGDYTTGGPPPTVRFDYIFRAFDQNWRVTPVACWEGPDYLADHVPVIADFQVQ